MCSGGADSLTPEHLKHCGSIFKKWLCQLFNHLLRLEQIPSVFKHGVIIPVYKGKGKDPLSVKSFRGITLSSMISKQFEFVLLERIVPFLEDSSCPQLTQSAYRKNVSCVDSIFASQEAVRFFTAEGDHVYSSFYDLQCAFDTVEYCILLEELFNAGLKCKLWKIIKYWYTNPTSCVRVCNKISAHFSIGRGVRQGSVLSPTLFNLVLDPLLTRLKSMQLGLNINGLFLGPFAHADDLRAHSTSLTDAKTQCLLSTPTQTLGVSNCPEKCAVVIAAPVSSNI